MIDLATADALARRAHEGGVDRYGQPFLDHVYRVSAHPDLAEPRLRVLALLHDAVEKGTLSWLDLCEAGADFEMLAALDAITEREGESGAAYLRRCAANRPAARVKRIDLLDKLDPCYVRRLTPSQADEARRRAISKLVHLDALRGAAPAEHAPRHPVNPCS